MKSRNSKGDEAKKSTVFSSKKTNNVLSDPRKIKAEKTRNISKTTVVKTKAKNSSFKQGSVAEAVFLEESGFKKTTLKAKNKNKIFYKKEGVNVTETCQKEDIGGSNVEVRNFSRMSRSAARSANICENAGPISGVENNVPPVFSSLKESISSTLNKSSTMSPSFSNTNALTCKKVENRKPVGFFTSTKSEFTFEEEKANLSPVDDRSTNESFKDCEKINSTLKSVRYERKPSASKLLGKATFKAKRKLRSSGELSGSSVEENSNDIKRNERRDKTETIKRSSDSECDSDNAPSLFNSPKRVVKIARVSNPSFDPAERPGRNIEKEEVVILSASHPSLDLQHWDEFVEKIVTIRPNLSGGFTVFILWVDGKCTAHCMNEVRIKSPQKLIEYFQINIAPEL